MIKSSLNQIDRIEIPSKDELEEYGGIQHLTSLLVHNSSVTYLGFFVAELGPQGAKHIVQLLLRNTCLEKIRITWSSDIGDEGAKYLADGIKSNSTLQEMNLSYNEIGDYGVNCLVGAIKVNSTLQQILLRYNEIRAK
jgi:Ran GTPase-activating protein (RanGAP) involved in mRNA processing and transport